MAENVDGLQPDRFDPLYYLYDGLGSASQLVNGDGEVWNKFLYQPFGEPKAAGKLLLNRHKEELLHVPFGFTGEAHDFYSGLIYLRARYYDPGVGSFISRDSYLGNLMRPLSQNRYTYVENNPINYIDPSGYNRYITSYYQLTTNLSLKDRMKAVLFAMDDVFLRGLVQKLTGISVKDTAICENSDELEMAYEIEKEILSVSTILIGMGMSSINELELVEKTPQDAGKTGVIEQHHQLPQKFKRQFEKAGLDIEDYKVPLDKADHRLKPDGLHTGKNSWNKQWDDFFKGNPDATKPEILNQLDKMQKDFGLK